MDSENSDHLSAEKTRESCDCMLSAVERIEKEMLSYTHTLPRSVVGQATKEMLRVQSSIDMCRVVGNRWSTANWWTYFWKSKRIQKEVSDAHFELILSHREMLTVIDTARYEHRLLRIRTSGLSESGDEQLAREHQKKRTTHSE